MEKRWTVKSSVSVDDTARLSKELNTSLALSTLLMQRGITSFDEAKKYFRPSLEDLHDPYLMKGMKEAVERINVALEQNEKILVYGDYDVDGTTAVALMYTFLCSLSDNVSFYVPDRYKEGYGISTQGIDFAHDNEFSLIIALDCGIKSIDKVDYAKERSIDFIICDHHRPGDEIPAAVAVLDPKRKDCDYPFKELSGCGIGFKLVQALSISRKIPFEKIQPLLDLVAVSTAADIVPMVEENRVLMYYGLEVINTAPRPGIKSILEVANVKRQLSSTDLVFIIGPRINAAGRVESATKAVELLISDNMEHATQAAHGINATNLDRRTLDADITQHALSLIEEDVTFRSRKSTVLFNSTWHKGVIGIVASRLIEKHYKPTIILTESNGMATGSARSVKDFDVYEAIEECSSLLLQFGGHKYAAGLTLPLENVVEFTEKFEQVVSTTIEDHLLVPEIEIDIELQLRDIDDKFYRILKQFAPFGPGNMAPVFMTRRVHERGYAKVVGERHLKLQVYDGSQPDVYYSCIAFGLADKLDIVTSGEPFDISYAVEENVWNGNVSLQLNVKDIRSAQ